MNKRKEITDVLSRLPKSDAAKIIKNDAAVHSFFRLLLERDPYDVIDEMFVYYTMVMNNQREQIEYFMNHGHHPPIHITVKDKEELDRIKSEINGNDTSPKK